MVPRFNRKVFFQMTINSFPTERDKEEHSFITRQLIFGIKRKSDYL